MGFRSPGGGSPMQMMVPFKGVVRFLVLATVATWFLLQILLEQFLLDTPLITQLFALHPGKVIEFFIWQPLTYMFLHSTDPFHILFNMLILWWLGTELEQTWGAKYFTIYYFASGIGAAIIYTIVTVLYSIISGNLSPLVIPVLGASGAVFGLLLAYGILFGDRVVYFMFIFPMQARWFVMLLGGVEVIMLINQGIGGGKVANLAHLGGILAGYLTLVFTTWWRRRRKPPGSGGRKLKLVVDNAKPKYWN